MPHGSRAAGLFLEGSSQAPIYFDGASIPYVLEIELQRLVQFELAALGPDYVIQLGLVGCLNDFHCILD